MASPSEQCLTCTAPITAPLEAHRGTKQRPVTRVELCAASTAALKRISLCGAAQATGAPRVMHSCSSDGCHCVTCTRSVASGHVAGLQTCLIALQMTLPSRRQPAARILSCARKARGYEADLQGLVFLSALLLRCHQSLRHAPAGTHAVRRFPTPRHRRQHSTIHTM